MKKYVWLILIFLLIFFILVYSKNKIHSFKELILSCPVDRQYCNQGKIVRRGQRYFGIGYKLPVGTNILAISEGKAEGGGVVSLTVGSEKERYQILTVKEANNNGIEYIFTGKPLGENGIFVKNVSSGEVMFGAREGEIGNMGVNLIVRKYENIEGKKEIKEIKPWIFGSLIGIIWGGI